MSNIIEIKDLVKEYKMFPRKRDRLVETMFPFIHRHGTFKAIDGLNLELKKGDVLGILGQNGAGKSTLLKMITGVVSPTSGTLEVNGKISSLLELGTAFNPELTGIENIYQHGQVMGLTKKEIEDKKQEIIDFADIGEHIDQPVKTYSSGMFARLAFACAINVDPDVLIVDEVLSVGDMAFQLKCFKKFEDFKKKGKTILFVTHSVTDVIRNCNRVIILEHGKKTFDGDVKEGTEIYKKMMAGRVNANQKSNVKNANSKIIEYGNGKAEIVDFGLFDENNEETNIIDNEKDIYLRYKVNFNEDVNEPIFTMTVKDFNGLEIVGTNTMHEGIATGKFNKGTKTDVEFKMKLPLAPNKYTVSFSCTNINAKGELEVLSRKYDALLVEVVSSKPTVGLYKIDPEIRITNE